MKENVEKFGSLNILSASPFEQNDVHIKNAYLSVSQRQESGMEESVKFLKIGSNMEYQAEIGEKVEGIKLKCRRRIRL